MCSEGMDQCKTWGHKFGETVPLNGQSNKIFDLFSSIEPAWATNQWVKIFLILLKISQSSSNFSGYHTAQSQYPHRIILRRVNIPTGSSCAESISPQDHTVQSQYPHRIIQWRVNIPTGSYSAESISPQYHTAQSQSWLQPFLKTFTQAFKGTVWHK